MCQSIAKQLLDFALADHKNTVVQNVLTALDALMPACKQFDDALNLRNVLCDAMKARVAITHHQFAHQADGEYDKTLAFGKAAELDSLLAARCTIKSSCNKVTALDNTSEFARACTIQNKARRIHSVHPTVYCRQRGRSTQH